MRSILVKWYKITFSAPEEGEEYCDEGECTDEGTDEVEDYNEGLSLVGEVAKYLRDQGATEPSSCPFSPGCWYTARGENYRTGESTETSYHLGEGLTEAEAAEVYALVTKR